MKHHSKAKRLPTNRVRRINDFVPLWVKCRECNSIATANTDSSNRTCQCKCESCGAIYQIPFAQEHTRQFVDLPLWLKANFRGEVFWAVNGEHLDFLEEVVAATLREKVVSSGARLSLNGAMPYNLPSWLLSAKNRPNLVRLIKKLKKTIPVEWRIREQGQG
jgi:hypothetical protein